MSNFISKKLYKALKNEEKEIDWLMWIVGLIGPLVTVPQVALVYINQSTDNISHITWGLYLFIALVMFSYGFIHRIKPLIVGQLLYILVFTAMAIGIITYS